MVDLVREFYDLDAFCEALPRQIDQGIAPSLGQAAEAMPEQPSAVH